MPNLLNLAAMKAFALGRRAKWKDYVDMYWLLKSYFSLEDVEIKSAELFGDLFSPKLFRQQLCFFDDIDYSETVNYIDKKVEPEIIKSFLTEIALKPL